MLLQRWLSHWNWPAVMSYVRRHSLLGGWTINTSDRILYISWKVITVISAYPTVQGNNGGITISRALIAAVSASIRCRVSLFINYSFYLLYLWWNISGIVLTLYNVVIAISLLWEKVHWMRQVLGWVELTVGIFSCVGIFTLPRVLCFRFNINWLTIFFS